MTLPEVEAAFNKMDAKTPSRPPSAPAISSAPVPSGPTPLDALRSLMQPGDELWHFSPPRLRGRGSEGYVVLRDGRAVATFTTRMWD